MAWTHDLARGLGKTLEHPVVLVGAGSFVGGNLRYYLGRWVATWGLPGGLPWGTFFINVAGSFVLGLVAEACLDRLEPARRLTFLLLGTGLCGGFTTFSSFEWETHALARSGRWPWALAYVGGSALAGFVAVALGAALAQWLFPRR